MVYGVLFCRNSHLNILKVVRIEECPQDKERDPQKSTPHRSFSLVTNLSKRIFCIRVMLFAETPYIHPYVYFCAFRRLWRVVRPLLVDNGQIVRSKPLGNVLFDYRKNNLLDNRVRAM